MPRPVQPLPRTRFGISIRVFCRPSSPLASVTNARLLQHLALCLLAVLCSGSVSAQTPLYLVNDSTEVRRVEFRFATTQTFKPSVLKAQIATTAPGYFQSGWRASVLSALPIIPEPGVFPFSPVELQKDLIRLSRYYDRNGFLNAIVDYDVKLDTSRNDVDVTFAIGEGEPLRIDSLWFAGPGGGTAVQQLEEDIKEEWIAFRNEIILQSGERLDDYRLINLQDRTIGWLRDRGYAFADASAETRVDTVALEADVRIKLNAGPRGQVAGIEVDGAESVEPIVVRRELPFQPGDLFRQRELTEGQRQIFGLNLFQLASVNIAPDQPADSTVDIIVRVREGPPRYINALAGYYSDGGITGSAQWTHRNFLGAARSFTASLSAQSGIGAVGSYPIVDYEARLSLRQPYVLHRRFSGGIEPFVRYRDDVVEVATQYGVTTSLLYELGPVRNATLSTTISARSVGSNTASLVDPSSLLPGDAFTIARSQLRLSGVFGVLDSPFNPRSGYVIRPSASASGLLFTDATYGALGLSATAFLPLGDRLGLVLRGSGGALFAAGSTDPANEVDYLALRNELFFAGGTTDVRGWAGNLLGPKFLDFSSIDSTIVFATGDDVATYYNARYRVRYRPVGSESKATASIQLNLPLPLGESWGASLFMDAGRVWRPAEGLYDLFENAAPDFPNLSTLITQFRQEEETIRYGVGAGIQYLTPVGYLNFAVGTKLNPSYFDLRSPQDILVAADIEGLASSAPDFDAVPASWIRRLQFHFLIAQRF